MPILNHFKVGRGERKQNKMKGRGGTPSPHVFDVMVVKTFYCDICGSSTKKLKKVTVEFTFDDRTFSCCCDCHKSIRRLIYRELWRNKLTDDSFDMVERERLSDDTQSIPRHALSDN